MSEQDNTPEAVAASLGFAGIMAGQKARTADKAKLAKAIELEKEGIPPQNIFQATGWYRGTDGEWKFEISDTASKLNTVREPPLQGAEAADYERIMGKPSTGEPASTGKVPLESVLEHPALYEAYPQLRNLPYQQMDLGFLNAEGMSDQYGVALHRFARDPRSTLLHELQHQIQQHEGFALGGNPDQVGTIGFSPDQLGDDPFDAYRRLAGEVEARNVQNRLAPPDSWSRSAGRELLAEDVAKVNPIFSEDIPAARQLKYFNTTSRAFPQMEFLQLLAKVLR